MLQIRLTLNSTRDSEPNNLPPLSDDKILRALSFFCKVQSSLSRDEIINLYERVGAITKCLVNYDIEDNDSPLQPPAARLCDTGVTNASPFLSRFVDPSLITLDQGARDHPMITSFPTLESDRFHSPAQSRTRDQLSELPSSPFDKEVQGHRASSALDKHRAPHVEIDRVIPTTHSAFGCDENDFDLVLREIEGMESSGHSSGVRPGSCDRTNDPESSTCPLGGGSNNEGLERVDPDEYGPTTSQLRTQISACDGVEGRRHDISDKLPPRDTSVGNTEDCSREMDTADVEDRNSPDTTRYDNHTPVPEASAGSRSSDRGASHSVPQPSMLDTPTTPMPTKIRVESADGTPGENLPGQTSNNCQSTHLSKFQPTVEDAPDETEPNNADDPFANDDEFGGSEIEAVLDEARRFLGDPSADYESLSSEATNPVNTELTPNASFLAPYTPDSNDQRVLPDKEQRHISQASSEKESRDRLRKRKLSSIVESEPGLPSRNLRARLPHSVSQKTSCPPNLDKDRWKGRFSHHTLLSTLLPDQKDEIERKSNRVLRSDLPDFIEKHTKIWKSTGFWSSPSFDLPNGSNTFTGRKGRAIWKYVEAMQTEGETHYLKSRFADIMLYLEYVKEFNRQMKAGHPVQTAKIRATNAICGTSSLPKASAEKTRTSFHEHKVVGERWWWSACYLGRGFILLCSEETGKKVRSKSFKLDPFILYILYNCRGVLSCCSKFDEVVDTLLKDGRFPNQINKKEVQQWMKDIKSADHESVPTIHWQSWSTDAVASMASDFLFARSRNRS